MINFFKVKNDDDYDDDQHAGERNRRNLQSVINTTKLPGLRECSFSVCAIHQHELMHGCVSTRGGV